MESNKSIDNTKKQTEDLTKNLSKISLSEIDIKKSQSTIKQTSQIDVSSSQIDVTQSNITQSNITQSNITQTQGNVTLNSQQRKERRERREGDRRERRGGGERRGGRGDGKERRPKRVRVQRMPDDYKSTQISEEYIQERRKVASNHITFDFDIQNDEKFYFYSISIKGFFAEELKNSIIRRMRFNEDFKNQMRKLFQYIEVRGAGMYCQGLPDVQDKIEFHIVFKEGRIAVVTPEYYKDNIENPEINQHLFIVTLEKKQTVKNTAEVVDEKEGFVAKHFTDIYFTHFLNACGYYKSTNGRVYFKMAKNSKGFKMPTDYIDVDEKSSFVKGYSIASSFYSNNRTLIKIMPRYRLLHAFTFWDYYKQIGENKKAFYEFATTTKGYKTYQFEEVNCFDNVIYEDPSKLLFVHKKYGSVSISDYMTKYWNIKIENKIQPILVKKSIQYIKKKGVRLKQRVDVDLYYLPQFMYISGKLEHMDIKLNQITKPTPKKTYDATMQIIKDVKTHRQENKDFKVKSNFKPLEFDAVVLKKPVLEFANNVTSTPDDSGRINLQNKRAKDDQSNNNWFMVATADVEEADVIQLRNEFLRAGELVLKKPLDMPKGIITLNVKTSRSSEEEIKKEILNKVMGPIKADEEKGVKYLFFVVVLPNVIESTYRIVKNEINNCGLKTNNQVVTVSKLLNCGAGKTLSICVNVINQILAKNNNAPWRFTPINKELQTRTLIITYATRVGRGNEGVTTISYSLNSDFNKHFFIQKIHKVSSRYICPDLRNYFKLALEEFCRTIKEPRPIDNIIIYRDGLNVSQIAHAKEFELNNIIEGLKDMKQSTDTKHAIFKNTEICFIIVSVKNDTKLFQLEPFEGNEIQHPDVSLLSNRLDVFNNPVGLLVNDVIIMKGKIEFYMISAFSEAGTTNPTRYIIAHDTTTLPLDFIYTVTLGLCFLYFNNTKSIKIPAPLHLSVRRNAIQTTCLEQEWKNRYPGISY
jgi:hypothetical protein